MSEATTTSPAGGKGRPPESAIACSHHMVRSELGCTSQNAEGHQRRPFQKSRDKVIPRPLSDQGSQT